MSIGVVSRLRRGVPSLLRDDAFSRFWTAQTVSYVGDQVTTMALPLVAVLALHASPAAMGILAAAVSLPNLAFSIHLGALVDRRVVDRRGLPARNRCRHRPNNAPDRVVGTRDFGGCVPRHDSRESVSPRDHWPAEH